MSSVGATRSAAVVMNKKATGNVDVAVAVVYTAINVSVWCAEVGGSHRDGHFLFIACAIIRRKG